MKKNNSVYSWNIVYNFVFFVKHAYAEMVKEPITYSPVEEENNGIKKTITVFEYWVKTLGVEDYIKKIESLQFTQDGNLLLIRYANYASLFNEESTVDVTPEDLWERDNGFLCECRSLVVDLANEEIVLCPFRKFRNLNECEKNSTENIQKEIKTAKSIEVTNKLDGSMQSAGFYRGEVVMSGSQALSTTTSWRLEDGKNILLNNENMVRMLKENENLTFIFEYISLADAHVVFYSKEQEGLYLIGIRDKFNGRQFSYKEVFSFAKKYDILTTESYNLTFAEVIDSLSKYKSSEKEGYVMNIDGHMIKIKCDDYVELHKILSIFSSVNLVIKNYANDTLDDLLSKIPDNYKGRIEKIVATIKDYDDSMRKKTEDYFSAAPKDNRRDFMLWVDKNVPSEFRAYVKNIYLGRDFSFIKTNAKEPHYKTLKEMGITANYSLIFND